MELNLTKILSSLTVVAAWAYSLGWIKTLYYFRAFGIGLESVEFSPQDYLFASWYAVENVMFFIFLLWIAAVARRAWIYLIVLAYLPLPFLTELANYHLDSPTWSWLVRWFVSVPHSILKFVPFLVLFVALLVYPESRERFEKSSWPPSHFVLVALTILAVAWSISAAKHFGSSEADEVLRDPAKSLLHVRLRISETAHDLKPIESRQSLYLLYSGVHRCILLDSADFAFGKSGAHVNILYVPPDKIELIDGLRQVQTDPGRLFW